MNQGDGTCEHYGRIDHEFKICSKCWMSFLACPKCKPIYCPDCRKEGIVLDIEVPFCKAKAKSLARVKAWRQRHKQLAWERV